VTELVRKVYGGGELATPDWLQRPGPAEAGRRWRVLQRIYHELTATELPEVMPPRERRTVDCVLQRRGEAPRIVEFDEKQHFNRYRALTIRSYPRATAAAFDRRAWLRACEAKRRLEGGGFGVPKPPLLATSSGDAMDLLGRSTRTQQSTAWRSYWRRFSSPSRRSKASRITRSTCSRQTRSSPCARGDN